MAKDGTLVFVEVKTRRDSQYARKFLLDNVTQKKKRKLRNLTYAYLNFRYRNKPRPNYRIDIVGVLLERENLALKEIIYVPAINVGE